MEASNRLHEHPVFICGHPKSGTSLLRALLDSHPQLLVYPDETFFFRGFLPEIRTLSPQEKVNLAQRYLLHFFTPLQADESSEAEDTRLYEEYAQTCQAMQTVLDEQGYHHDGDLLSAAVIGYGRARHLITADVRRWVEKTPYNEHFATQIFNWWPQARCIHVVRDPRDNYAAYHRKHPRLNDAGFGWSWNASLARGLHNEKEFGSHRYLIIRYEDLILESEQTLAKIREFLEIGDHPTLRQPTYQGVLWQGNSMFNEKFGGISASPLGRWKTNLSPRQRILVETLCARGMKQMGYARLGGFDWGVYPLILKCRLKQLYKFWSAVNESAKIAFGLSPRSM